MGRKPMPGGIEETVRNLQEISPTVYFNVPRGFDMLIAALRGENFADACGETSS